MIRRGRSCACKPSSAFLKESSAILAFCFLFSSALRAGVESEAKARTPPCRCGMEALFRLTRRLFYYSFAGTYLPTLCCGVRTTAAALPGQVDDLMQYTK